MKSFIISFEGCIYQPRYWRYKYFTPWYWDFSCIIFLMFAVEPKPALVWHSRVKWRAYLPLHGTEVSGTFLVSVVLCQVCSCESINILVRGVHVIGQQDCTALLEGIRWIVCVLYYLINSLIYFGNSPTSSSPFSAASWSGVPPQWSLLISEPIWSRFCKMQQCPLLAAKCRAVAPSPSWQDRLTSVHVTCWG